MKPSRNVQEQINSTQETVAISRDELLAILQRVADWERAALDLGVRTENPQALVLTLDRRAHKCYADRNFASQQQYPGEHI